MFGKTASRMEPQLQVSQTLSAKTCLELIMPQRVFFPKTIRAQKRGLIDDPASAVRAFSAQGLAGHKLLEVVENITCYMAEMRRYCSKYY